MSKRINVNPDHYKIAGRERPGDGLERSKEPARKRTVVRSGAGSPNFIPGAAAVGEPDDRMAQTRERARQAVSKAKKK
ncbi:MAG: hypothetical protein ACYC7A_10335 [Thermoanaerobaculia bacterium]